MEKENRRVSKIIFQNRRVRRSFPYLCLLSILTLSFFSKQQLLADEPNQFQHNCKEIKLNDYSDFIFHQIQNSSSIKPNQINCSDLAEINNLDPEKLVITTGRKNRESVVCLSDNKSKPCTYVIASFQNNIYPSKALLQTFNAHETHSDTLNETTSRIFLRPYEMVSKARTQSQNTNKKTKLKR